MSQETREGRNSVSVTGQPAFACALTPSGWKRLIELNVGDDVVTWQGGLSRITDRVAVPNAELMAVHLSDGRVVHCARGQEWLVETSAARWRGAGATTKSIGEVATSLHYASGNRRHLLVSAGQFDFAARELPLDPYLVGVLLGDGAISSHSATFVTADDEIVQEVARIVAPIGASVVRTTKPFMWYIRRSSVGRNAVVTALRELGLLGLKAPQKFVPEPYKWGAASIRLQILQGLLDTDGYAGKNNQIVFVTTSRQLAEDVRELVESLGGFCTESARAGTVLPRLDLLVRLPLHLAPFRLTRKAARYRRERPFSRCIARIEAAGRDTVYQIRVNGPFPLYIADNYVVVHDSSSARVRVPAAFCRLDGCVRRTHTRPRAV